MFASPQVALPSSPSNPHDALRGGSVNHEVLIAVDPHKAHNTLAVLDPVTKTAVDAAKVANSIRAMRR
jgi:hypothetical protein